MNIPGSVEKKPVCSLVRFLFLCSSVPVSLFGLASFFLNSFLLYFPLCFSSFQPPSLCLSLSSVLFFFSILSPFKTSVNFPLPLFSFPFPSVPSRFFLFFSFLCLVPPWFSPLSSLSPHSISATFFSPFSSLSLCSLLPSRFSLLLLLL
ncbi:hypothetical protein NC653_013778 [Populus alba x Populus x berolinensis]|uniref:Transmembrane protein n=1 Tax=Populus alba x Populus x berolinensis TaxID=444605 RepID=A0AAD6W2X2_9ROSI|nr:hypothetical protein NC653_013778 [Populus alba x Populus x berolinensis]